MPSRRRRAVPALVVGASIILAATVFGGLRAGAEEQSSYEAVAVANGVRVSVSAPNFAVVDTIVDGGGPVAQSLVDGLGNSRGFAALPYPGDLALTGPGLAAGLLGLPAPPPYPFAVDSTYPTKAEAKVAQPGYELVAHSAAQSSEASVAMGSTTARAQSSRDLTTGTVSAAATGSAAAVDVGGLVRIGHLQALARATRDPNGELTREAGFVIDAMTIAGQTVGISDQGLTTGPANTPIPPGNPLLEALAQAKITVRYLGRIDNPDGVVSPGLVITQEQQIPSGPTVIVRYLFGQMSASASASDGPAAVGDTLPAETGPASASPNVVDPTSSPGTSPETPPAPSAGSPGEEVPVFGGDTGSLPDMGGFGATPREDGSTAGAAPEVPALAPEVQLASPASQTPPLRVDTASIYLVLAAGAAVALAGGFVLRLAGVKLKWIS